MAIFSIGFFLPQTMPTKTLLYTTRLREGWKQATLATYLRVTSTLLSMAEVGERELPMPAYLRLLKLIQLLPTTLEEEQPLLTAAENDQYISRIGKEIKKKTRELSRLQVKVAQAKEYLLLLATKKKLQEQVMGAPDFNLLERRERDFWLQRQIEVGQERIADVYFDWLKANWTLELLTIELQFLQKHVALDSGEVG